MTYDELLVEFRKKRAQSSEPRPHNEKTDMRLDDLEWVVVSILHNLRDKDKP